MLSVLVRRLDLDKDSVPRLKLIVQLYALCAAFLSLVWWYDIRLQSRAGGMKNVSSALYYILTGASTIGYGDLHPVTNNGRLGCALASACLILICIVSCA